MFGFKVPPKVYFKRGSTDLALRELSDKKRAFIVSDRFLFNSGALNTILDLLETFGTDHQIYTDVKPDPTFADIKTIVDIVNSYSPDLIIAVGGGSPMDAAKLIWLLYEQPEVDISKISMKFWDVEKDLEVLDNLGSKASFVTIPTTSGTGSEVTPFAIIKDEKDNSKITIADYALTPDMAIVDANYVDRMPKGLTAASGLEALIQAIEAYISPRSTNFTNSNALEAIKLIFRYLTRSFNEGANDPIAREKMHYASTISGMALANAFPGLCHYMSYELGAMYHVPHGVANGLLIRQMIKYNAQNNPVNLGKIKDYAGAKVKYGQIADELKLGGQNDDEKVELLIKEIDRQMDEISMPKSLKQLGIKEEVFLENIDTLTERLFDNQKPNKKVSKDLKNDVKQLFLDAYYGKV